VTPTKTTEIAIDGMTCASCVARVRSSLEAVDGVSAARVNLATERAQVDHDPRVGAAALVGAVKRAGYDASQLDPGLEAEEDDARRRDAEIARKRRLLIVGVALFLPALALGMMPIFFGAEPWFMLALAAAAWATIGTEFHRGAISEISHGGPGMDSLVSLGSTAALATTLKPH